MNTSVESTIEEKAKSWLAPGFDENTRKSVQQLIDSNPEELTECFYTNLEFGTGGMRGLMGVGTNRVNKYTIGMATQGLANYLKESFEGEISVAIAYDCRNNSDFFAKTTADVFSANGIKVFLFDELRPTPELSFAIRHLGCKSGVVVTASHNPKEYNGYKVYWEDGAQIVAPHDKNIIKRVMQITSIDEVKFDGNPDLIEKIGSEIDEEYLNKVSELSLSPKDIADQKDLKIVYTALHGTGVKLVPAILKKVGFENVSTVAAQNQTSGDFPTVVSPNPEEEAAMKMSLEQAEKEGAEILLGTDPDSDRVGVGVRTPEGDYTLLNGNETATLLVYYQLLRWREQGRINGRQFVAKTVVTTELIDNIASSFGAKVYDTLTGFKHIAAKIRELEGRETFVTGGEESYGYLSGDFVRDKDAVSSAMMICEIAAWAKNQGKSLIEILEEIHRKFGFYREALISVVKKGKAGKEEIAEMMRTFRTNPPQELGGSKVIRINDILDGTSVDLETGHKNKIALPQSNVLQFYTEDGSKVTARPSGTEPKIKFYFSVNQKLKPTDNYKEVKDKLNQKLETLKKDFTSQ
ncbi:phospho-sugar mutase [Halocola ammonii]